MQPGVLRVWVYCCGSGVGGLWGAALGPRFVFVCIEGEKGARGEVGGRKAGRSREGGEPI